MISPRHLLSRRGATGSLVCLTLLLTLASHSAVAEHRDGSRPLPAAEAMHLGWPQLAGPLGDFSSVEIDVPLVDDLSQARKLWESDFRDLGRAKGNSGAYRRAEQFTAAEIARFNHPGSWAGPIVAEGLVFCSSWRPVGEWRQVEGLEVRRDAEDIVIALDAETGKTRWLAREPGGMLLGGGKRQGHQVSPVYHAGVVYSVGSTGRIFAHRAATGEKLWDSDVHPQRAAMKAKRDESLAGIREGKWTYDLNPNWCSSLAFIGETLIVPDQVGGLVGVDPKSGMARWQRSGVIARWATPSTWRHEGRENLLCANEKGELRLIDPDTGRDRWTLAGLGPNWFTLTPGRTHVLVNVVPRSGKVEGKPVAGRLGAVRLTLDKGERDWEVKGHSISVWMDSGARIRVMYQAGRFLLPHEQVGADAVIDGEPLNAASGRASPAALLIEEESGKVLARLPAPERRDDWLGGLIYWSGDRIVSRGDSFHGPKHGGRHPWLHWSTKGDRLVQLPGKMDLADFTTAYEVMAEAPLVAGRMFERTEAGTIVCYDLRKE
jgi:outer membrane protein assembly factor BamB